MLAEISLPSADPRRKIADSVYLLQLLLSDKYRYIEQELLLLGIASLLKKGLPIRWSTQKINKNLRRRARHTENYSFCGALAPRLATAPFAESRSCAGAAIGWFLPLS